MNLQFGIQQDKRMIVRRVQEGKEERLFDAGVERKRLLAVEILSCQQVDALNHGGAFALNSSLGDQDAMGRRVGAASGDVEAKRLGVRQIPTPHNGPIDSVEAILLARGGGHYHQFLEAKFVLDRERILGLRGSEGIQ